MSATDFPPDPDETDETDETGETDGATIVVGNDEFLRTLFDDLTVYVAPVVTSFVGNPASVSPAAWKSRRWRDGDTALPAEANNYFRWPPSAPMTPANTAAARRSSLRCMW